MKLFKKKEEDPQIKPIQFSINNRDYIAEYDTTFKVQSVAEDVNVYGWVLETRYKFDGKWTHWVSYYNNRIYHSRESAVDASMKIRSMYRDSSDAWRISPIYKMNEPQYRDYKINKILGDDKKPNTFEIKGWKLNERFKYHSTKDKDFYYENGTVFIQLENGSVIISGGCVKKNQYLHYRKRFVDEVLPNADISEIEILDEKWLHPHLLRELKIKLKIKN